MGKQAWRSPILTYFFSCFFSLVSTGLASELLPREFFRDPAIQQWVLDQNTRSRDFLGQNPLQPAIRKRAGELTPKNAPVVTNLLGLNFFVERGSLILRGENGQPNQTIVDVTRLPVGAVVTEYSVSPDKQKLAYGFAVNGTDWTEWYAIDLTNRAVLAGPYYVKSSGNDTIAWDVDSQGFFYQRTSPSATEDLRGVRRPQVRYHRLGTRVEDDKVVFEPLTVAREERYRAIPLDASRVIVHRVQGAAEIPLSAYLVYRRGDSFSQRPEPLIAANRYWGRFVGIDGEKVIFRSSKQGSRYGIHAIDVNTRRETVLVSEQEAVLIQAQQIGQRLVLQYLERDLTNRIAITDLHGQLLAQYLPSDFGLPNRGTLGLLTGNHQSETGYFTYSSVALPTQTLRFDVQSNTVSKVTGGPVNFNGAMVREELAYYRSLDRTEIPIHLYSRTDSTEPVKFVYLFFYGNIGIANLPQFNRKLQLMLELGGLVAIANVRGGGEYGLPWQQAGTFNKWRTIQDVVGASRYLKQRFPEVNGRVALSGRSFGGMLTMAEYVHFQSEFDVFTPIVSVSDPLAFANHELGWWSWDDFGFRRNSWGLLELDARSFASIASWSPMRHVNRLASVKPIMAFSGEFDTRTGPDQTARFVRALQSRFGAEAPVFMIEHEKIGHNGRAEIVDEAVFIATQFGLTELNPMRLAPARK